MAQDDVIRAIYDKLNSQGMKVTLKDLRIVFEAFCEVFRDMIADETIRKVGLRNLLTIYKQNYIGRWISLKTKDGGREKVFIPSGTTVKVRLCNSLKEIAKSKINNTELDSEIQRKEEN